MKPTDESLKELATLHKHFMAKDPQDAEAVKALSEAVDQHLMDIEAAGKIDDHEFIYKSIENLIWLFAHRIACMHTEREGGRFVEIARRVLKPTGKEYFNTTPDPEHVMYRETERGEDYVIWCPVTGKYEMASWRTEDVPPNHWICEGCQAHVREGG